MGSEEKQANLWWAEDRVAAEDQGRALSTTVRQCSVGLVPSVS